jgi:hypothetical protein
MKEIEFYRLFFTPGGNGQVEFRLKGEAINRATDPLPPQDFTALAALLAQKNLAFDTVKKFFVSSDDNDHLNPGPGIIAAAV